jgi:CO dehydrogenase/acetyl-CoA synthase epsilon subunit
VCEFGSIFDRGGRSLPISEFNICKQGSFAFKLYEDVRINVIKTGSEKKEFNVRKVEKN